MNTQRHEDDRRGRRDDLDDRRGRRDDLDDRRGRRDDLDDRRGRRDDLEEYDGTKTLSRHQHIKYVTSSKELSQLKEVPKNVSKSHASPSQMGVGTFLGLEQTVGQSVILDDDADTKSHRSKGSTYNFKSVEEHLQRLCKDFEVRHPLILGEKISEKFTLIGENTSSLENFIKNDEDMKKINLTIKEHKGEQFQLLTNFTVSCGWVTCELLMRGSNGDDHFAVIPAHLFVAEKYFGRENEFISSLDSEDSIPFTFYLSNTESYVTREIPKFVLRLETISDFKVVLDIAALKVNRGFVIRSSGRYCALPNILQVTKSQLYEMADRNVKIYLSKGGPKGYVLHCSGEGSEGIIGVQFPSKVLVKGDCGTIMYVKDCKTGVKYMLGMLRLGCSAKPGLYGATILYYNIDELTNAMGIDSASLKDQIAITPCDEPLLQSLKTASSETH